MIAIYKRGASVTTKSPVKISVPPQATTEVSLSGAATSGSDSNNQASSHPKANELATVKENSTS